MKMYRVGIVGFGAIGKVHAYGYLNLPLYYDPIPLQARITHVCTGHRETAEKGAAQVGADTAVTDYRAITENPEIDIVHIATPNHLHKDALLSALRHGKAIYCEKPLVATLAEACEVEAAARDYRGTMQMVFHNRFWPTALRARQLIDAGFVGRVLQFRIAYQHAGNIGPQMPVKWKMAAATGGGVIADLASHAFDLANFYVGECREILAATQIAYPERPSAADPSHRVTVDVEDAVQTLVRLPSGAVGTIEASKLATGSEDDLKVEIHGTAGALRLSNMAPHYLEAFDATAADAPLGGLQGWTRIATGQRYPAPASGFPGIKHHIGWLRAHVECLANFLRCVAAGEPAQPGLAEGLYAQRMMEAARTSARTSRWVEV
jgi:predicted dehydrogenase